ncbi:SIR2 family NAD-dependent protein deacylase [Curtobacterium flaccumfaciens]|uniref:SIR2 family NAD-dependent protein deacylase n=1 Tax=Curtobacterium flaccumfaciens TaxID=2035 RepID=UPI0024A982D8|nr:SIR2 family protein [Curtobacterium flaccumfaciens]
MSRSDVWPQEVIDHATRRNLILLVGAGISASCSNDKGDSPPNWPKLILDAAQRIGMGDRLDELKALIAQERLLEAAELLKLDAATRSRTQDLFRAMKEAVDGSYGHLYEGGAWHESIVRAEPKVIVTTNYDKIIERATSSGYTVHEYDSSSIAADVRRDYPVLLKIHGSVDHVEDMVLSRRDYTDVRHKGAHAMEVLHALLLTRPCLLIGYRLHDPDLQLILENIFGSQTQVPAHYMLVSDEMPDYEREVLRYSYGVNVITYPEGEHSVALEYFDELAAMVAATPPPGI